MKDTSDIRILFLQDGDRRWARREGVSYADGYNKMAEKVGLLIDTLHELGVRKLYMPTNSVANLSRPPEQVKGFFSAYLTIPDFTKAKLKISLSGNLEKLPTEFVKPYEAMRESSKDNDEFELVLLLNWSILDEVVRVSNRLVDDGVPISEKSLLSNSDIPEPIDLIIRTGKRRRLSGFFPMSGQYAELYFMDILFPDITTDDIEKALSSYEQRAETRTYGK